MGRKLDLTGRTFGRLTVIEQAGKTPANKRLWAARCTCGNVTYAPAGTLTSGNTKSCGCLRQEKNPTNTLRHGHARQNGHTAEGNSWRAMKSRCFNPKDRNFKYYGGRGIRVCDRWMTFEDFLADMGPRPLGRTLDRIDPNGHYEPGNVVWADATQQSRNRRHVH